MMSPMVAKIARGRDCDDWRACRSALSVGGDPKHWRRAFRDYFRGRLDGRYFDPIASLRVRGKRLGEGFAIVAIQCSLIEFLESALQGTSYRYLRRGEKLGPYEYSSSQEIFVRFLTTRQPFSQWFDPALARDFYVSIRCGLLHEAQTKGGWLIRASGAAMIDGPRRILYRNNFQDALLEFVEWYGSSIETDATLQEAFLRKFDGLCK